MTHSQEHIVVAALKTKVGKFRLWHYVAAVCLLSYAVGYLVGKF